MYSVLPVLRVLACNACFTRMFYFPKSVDFLNGFGASSLCTCFGCTLIHRSIIHKLSRESAYVPHSVAVYHLHVIGSFNYTICLHTLPPYKRVCLHPAPYWIPDMTKVIEECESSLEDLDNKDMVNKHQEQINEVQKTFVKEVNSLVGVLSEMGNPFCKTSCDLFMLYTNDNVD